MQDSQIAKRRKKEMTEKAIREGGFYGKNGAWNSIITFSGDNRLYRERVETIIVKNKKFVFVKKKMDGSYYLPGGSTEKEVSHIDQAVNECREEAHIDVRNIQSTGITYKEKHETPKWAKQEGDVEWQGTYSEIYVAEYDSMFKGHIDKKDEDPFIRSGKFYTTKECFKFFRKEHRDALLWFLKNNSETDEETVTESYVSNYFKNKKLLKRISHNPEVERSAVDQMVSVLKKEYRKLSSTSKIQRERKRSDVGEIFHPILTFDFSDGNTITIAICFDDSEFSDGIATHTEKHGDIVVVYPCFFNTTKENQIFTILHEFGHIRLHHLESKHNKYDIFGNDISSEYRLRLMTKGKVMYPEVNADLYAVLNGASMYSILNSAVHKDVDENYDYRFTNQELANRHSQVFKKYGKLRGYGESQFSRFDIGCLSIYELVYENSNIDYLTEEEKNELYAILYEYSINKKIKTDNNIIICESSYKEALKKYKDNITVLDNNELIYLKEAVNDSYSNLLYERAKVYESNTISDVEVKKYVCNNPKIAKFANYKSVFENGLMEEINDMIYKLKIKRDIVTEETEIEKIDHFLYLIESLSSSERAKIPKEKFGIPDTRSYPLDTRKHVISAIKLFGHCDKKYKKELAERIFNAMDEFNVSYDIIGKNSQLYKYIKK